MNLKKKQAEKPYFDNFSLSNKELLPQGYKSIADLRADYLRQKKDISQKDLCYCSYQLHKTGITSVAVTHDSRYIFTGSEESVVMYDIEETRQVHCFEDIHTGPIHSIAITSDNKYLVTGSKDCSIKIFDIETKIEEFHFPNIHQSTVYTVCLSKDDKYIISGSDDNSVKILDFKNKEELYHFEDIHESSVSCLAISQNDSYLVSGSFDRSVKIFDFQTRTEIYHFVNLHQDEICCVELSKRSKYLVTGSNDQSIKVIDFQLKTVLHHFQSVHLNIVSSLAISDEERYLISGSSDNTVKVFDLNNKIQIQHFANIHTNSVLAVAITKNQKYFVSASSDKTVKVFYLEAKIEQRQINDAHQDEIMTVVVSKDDKYIISASRDKSIGVFDLESGKRVHHFADAHKGPVNCLAVSKDNRHFASGSEDTNVKMFNLDSMSEVDHLTELHTGKIMGIAFVDDSRFLVSASSDESVKVFDFGTKSLVHCFPDAYSALEENFYDDASDAFKISENSKYIVFGIEQSVRILDLELKTEVYTFQNIHKDMISTVCITKDSKYIISGSDDTTVKILDLEAKVELYHFTGLESDWIKSLVLTDNDKYLVIGLLNSSIEVYDFETKQESYGYFPGFRDNTCAILSNDNKYIISWSTTEKSINIHNFRLFGRDDQIVFVSGMISAFTYFTNYDDIWLEGLSDPNVCEAYKDFYVLPHNWTSLHLLAIFKPCAFLEIPSYSDFRVPFLVDKYMKTPLHYLFSHDTIDHKAAGMMLKYTIDFLEDNRKTWAEKKQVSDSMSNILLFIIAKMSPKLVAEYLKVCSVATPAPYQTPLPEFGQVKIRSLFTESLVIQPETSKKMSQKGDQQLRFSSVLTYLDYDCRSDDMFSLVLHLMGKKAEVIFRSGAIANIIDHLWDQIYPLIIAVGILYSILMILISVYIALDQNIPALEIIIIIITVLFVAFECLKVIQLRKKHFESVSNLLHSAFLLLTIGWIASRFSDDNSHTLPQEWLSSLAIILGYLSWISYFRLFAPTRDLIEVSATIFSDLINILVILFIIITGFALVLLQFSRSEDYSEHLYSIYKLLYGDYEDGQFSLSQKLIVSFMLFIFNICFINLMISMFKSAYDRTIEKHVLTDSLTKLEIIREMMILLRAIKPKKSENKGYLAVCLALRADGEDEFEEMKDNLFKKLHRENDLKRKKEALIIKSEILRVRQEVTQNKQDLKHEINQVLKEVANSKRKAKEENDEVKFKIKNIKEEVTKNRMEIKRQLISMNTEIKRLENTIVKGQEEMINMIKSLCLKR